MKKLFVILTAVCVFLFGSASFAKEPDTSTEEVKRGDYIGHYDENMTPENSCLIFFCFRDVEKCSFKQINPKLDIDDQSFSINIDKNPYSTIIFKPCKPGSRYMLARFKGTSGPSYDYVYWDMDLKPNQQVFVIDVPKEPGIYFYGEIPSLKVAIAARDGKVFEIHEPNSSKYTKTFYKVCLKDMKKLYEGSPWLDAYIEKMNTVKNTKNKWR